MSHEIRADYTQTLMFPPCVEDWVPAHHPARFIREVVDAMDLAAMGFRISEGEEGRPHYAEALLLKVWLYGYCNRIRSTRGLQKACLENLSLIWLTGNNAPDHNTLWRFYRDNKQAIREVFKRSVRIGMEANLVGFVLHALDGTKMRAAASGRTALSRGQLEKALANLDAEMEVLERTVEETRAKEGEAGWELPRELSDAGALREAVRAGLAILREEEVKSLSVADPQARMMQTQDGKRMSYNAQAVADAASGLIVGNDVVNEANDMHQLAPMLERTAETLGGRAARETLADAGYGNPEQIAAARESGHEVLLPMNAEMGGAFHAVHFKRDIERDVLTCPLGQTLTFEKQKKTKSGRDVSRVYRCRHGRRCAHAAQCTASRHGRTVEVTPWHEATQAQIEKQKDPGARCRMKRRKTIIEPVFAAIKERGGFRRFTVHGLENVRTQWSLVCAAYNLMKLHKQWVAGTLKIPLETA